MDDLDTYLRQKADTLIASSHEQGHVQAALDNVSRCLDWLGQDLRIVERYPCGSFAKSTMLPGRMEADFVVVLREPPTPQILERLEAAFSDHLRGRRRMDPKYKALELVFDSGASVDLLPVAHDGLTVDAETVDERFRVGINGRRHAEWFIQKAHGSLLLPTVRLLKAIRQAQPDWNRTLSSFSLELVAVEFLRYSRSSLAENLLHVLTRLKNDPRSLRQLQDPADPSNRPLARRSDAQLDDVGRVATRLIEAIERGNASRLFISGASVPLASSNLGGRTLG